MISIIAPAEVIRELLAGPQQADEHCRGWRWHLYMRDTVRNTRRMDAVWAETRRIIARDEADQSEAA
jgi:hypothetical protein